MSHIYLLLAKLAYTAFTGKISEFLCPLRSDRRELERRSNRARERRARRTTTQPTIDPSPSASSLVNPQTPAGTPSTANATATDASAPNTPPPLTTQDKIYSRSVSLITVLSLTHFGVTNILLYSSTNSCRLTSPHLWWSTFAMLCLTYLIILEIFTIGFTLFVVLPVVFVSCKYVYKRYAIS